MSQQRIRKKPKEEDFVSEEEYEGFETPPSEKQRKSRQSSAVKSDDSYNIGRNDNSLGVLTKKFVSLIQKAENQCIDLNEAVQILNVQKRRIYDITNVLEGIGLIQKRHKNKIQWIGGSGASEHTQFEEMNILNKELEMLNKEEDRLDYWTNQIQESLNQLTNDPSYAEFAYVTYDDIKSLPNLTEYPNETLLAIRAPPGTSLEVPDPEQFPPEEKEKYQIYLHSKSGEILVYVVSSDKPIENEEPKILSTNTFKVSSAMAEELRKNTVYNNAMKNEGISDLWSV
ncbi:unnamed protein product [Blepharisma stoltei]|uniref:E2F/DP family winged-helix DNA-binding domain-containing protein n=1 Tax=Blepharisma stoltei TaxID=1481888 RepID=A0AAU9IJD8_9CILI|nr:unnamed protein product [Blepharisma stoltei]